MIPDINSAKTIVLSLMKSSDNSTKNKKMEKNPDAKIAKIHEKIEIVKKILNHFDELNRDTKIFERILKFTKNNNDSEIKKFRKSQCTKFVVSFENGIAKVDNSKLLSKEEINEIISEIPKDQGKLYFKRSEYGGGEVQLVINEASLKNFTTDQFWDFIKNKTVEKLIIQSENGKPFEFDKIHHLSQFIEIKPPLESLTRMVKIKLSNGTEVKQYEANQAILHLCGDWFIKNYSRDWHKVDNPIDFSNLQSWAFFWIYNKVNEGSLSHHLYIEDINLYAQYREEFLKAADFLQSPEYVYEEIAKSDLPRNFYFGQYDLEKYVGKVDEVPSVPEELLNALKGPCPIFNTEKNDKGLKMWQTHQILYIPPRVNNERFTSELFIKNSYPINNNAYHQIRYKCECDPSVLSQVSITNNGQPMENEGYWIAILRDYSLKKSSTYSGYCNFQDKMAKISTLSEFEKKYPGSDFPTILEALAYRIMLYGSGQEETSNPDWTFMRCKESIQKKWYDGSMKTLHACVGRERLTSTRGIVEDSGKWENPDYHSQTWNLPVRRYFQNKQKTI